ncbi:CO/xanthine dehydrogenase Mo-binding subunit [Saccharopolyspora phatthalungensis]|uniref:CO/xanthine dehydrogenase Mo-binding subunit n=1 Tax=Saccharopolyspora phatthalungensis TaxID=664693 RepID=A0A840QJZ2_9PSEU|nr:CO/xanthine dehydrogenase Mo-binding subunit [Saccharopolyspora phatthalungensis]
MSTADSVVSATFHTPGMHHLPIEPYTTTALWRDGVLRVHVPSQWVTGARAGLAETLGLRPEAVEVLSPYVGGAFGCKAPLLWHTVFTALAARALGRPVRLMVTRGQMFTVGPFRPQSKQCVRLGARADGRLIAYEHVEYLQTSRTDDNRLAGTAITSALYGMENVRLRAHLVSTDVNTPGSMRGPHEYGPLFAVESAIDELAAKCGLDPVEFRLRNDTARHPISGLPFSSRSLAQCLERGAAIFGWDSRDPRVGSMRDEHGRLVGWGCASSIYPVLRTPSRTSVRLEPNGRVRALVSGHELGTGAYTVLAQILADALGCPLDQVEVELGDSRLPPGPMTVGSSNTGSVGSAVARTARKARAHLLNAVASRRGLPGGRWRCATGWWSGQAARFARWATRWPSSARARCSSMTSGHPTNSTGRRSGERSAAERCSPDRKRTVTLCTVSVPSSSRSPSNRSPGFRGWGAWSACSAAGASSTPARREPNWSAA